MSEFQMKRLGRTGLTVSQFCLGTYQITGEFGIARTNAMAVLERAFESGINFVDTAQMYGYGESEELVGRAIAGFPGKQIHIASKIGHLYRGIVAYGGEAAYQNEDLLTRALEHSLHTLRRDRIDLFMIHEPDWPMWGLDLKTGGAPVMNVLERYKRKGVIGAIGLGSINADNCADLVETGRFDAFLIAINYDLIVRTARERLIPIAKKHDVGVIAATPFRQGVMVNKKDEQTLKNMGFDGDMIRRIQAVYKISDETGIKLPELGIRYLISDPDVDCVAIGAQTVGQLDMNMEAMKKGPLDADILNLLENL